MSVNAESDTYQPTRPVMSAAELDEHQSRARVNLGIVGDGYDQMGVLEDRGGWNVVSSWGCDGWDLGSWPYVMIYTKRVIVPGHPSTGVLDDTVAYGLATNCEGDFDTYTFATIEDRNAAMDYLFGWYTLAEGSLGWFEGLPEGITREDLDAGTATIPTAYRGPYRAGRTQATEPALVAHGVGEGLAGYSK